jgi:hypothetical protein
MDVDVTYFDLANNSFSGCGRTSAIAGSCSPDRPLRRYVIGVVIRS